MLEQLGLEFRAKGDTSESCFKTTFVPSIVIFYDERKNVAIMFR